MSISSLLLFYYIFAYEINLILIIILFIASYAMLSIIIIAILIVAMCNCGDLEDEIINIGFITFRLFDKVNHILYCFSAFLLLISPKHLLFVHCFLILLICSLFHYFYREHYRKHYELECSEDETSVENDEEPVS